MKRIEIGVGGSVKGALAEFASAWKRAARGGRLRTTPDRIDFSAMAALISTLTPRRLALLEHVGRAPGLSIRALARALERDYKRVHGDVVALQRLGLIKRDADGRLHAPYDEIVIRAQLKAAA